MSISAHKQLGIVLAHKQLCIVELDMGICAPLCVNNKKYISG